jgi:hypothetical protein
MRDKNLFFIKYVVFGIFILGLIVSVILRVIEILYEIDPTTGFFNNGSIVAPVLKGILIVLVAVFLVPFFIKNNLGSEAFTGKSKVNSIMSLLLGVALFIDTITQFGTFINNADLGTFVIAITELLASIFFFILSGQKLTGKRINLAGTALFPVIWGIIILGASFMHYTSIANISEFLFDVLKMVFVLVFLYYNARIVGRVTNNKEGKGVIAFGLLAAFFCIISTVPKVIAWGINSAVTTKPGTGDLLYIIFAVYIIDVVVEALFVAHIPEEEIGLVEANITVNDEDEKIDEE